VILVQIGDKPRVFHGTFTVGRLLNCALVIPASDPLVSLVHARFRNDLTADPRAWFVEDCGSANGTYLLGDGFQRRVRAPYELAKGDRIRLGRTILTVVPD